MNTIGIGQNEGIGEHGLKVSRDNQRVASIRELGRLHQ